MDRGMPNEGATDCIAPNKPRPADMAGSRKTATRVTPGATCFNSSDHFPAIPYSNMEKPVAFPPGRAKLSTYPAPTGSVSITNTTGMVRVARSNGPAVALPFARITSGADATSSAACLRTSSSLPPAQRVSTWTLRPSAQPNCCRACRNAASRACAATSPAA
jgi:hypothetical protein